MNPKPYSFKIGNIDCTILSDGISHISKERFLKRFPDVSEAQHRQAFIEIGQTLEQATSSFNILMLKVGEETILVDTGEAGRPYGGELLNSMALAGIAPLDISLIILTHSHSDHILGLADEDNLPVFPDACYVLSKEELIFWQTRIKTNVPEQQPILSMMQENGLRLIEMNEQIIEGVSAIPLIGHTSGQIGLLVESHGEKLVHLADLLHSPTQFAYPQWSAKFDNDKALSVTTRREMLAYSADENLLTLFYHLDFPSLGYVKYADTGFTWHPIEL